MTDLEMCIETQIFEEAEAAHIARWSDIVEARHRIIRDEHIGDVEHSPRSQPDCLPYVLHWDTTRPESDQRFPNRAMADRVREARIRARLQTCEFSEYTFNVHVPMIQRKIERDHQCVTQDA